MSDSHIFKLLKYYEVKWKRKNLDSGYETKTIDVFFLVTFDLTSNENQMNVSFSFFSCQSLVCFLIFLYQLFLFVKKSFLVGKKNILMFEILVKKNGEEKIPM